MKTAALVYGLFCYALTGLVWVYAVAFLFNYLLPEPIRNFLFPQERAPDSISATAVVIDFGLLALFGLQHSGMARQSFKRIWKRIIPEPIERST
ncbi:MAG TPA: hypothetical protein VKS79_16020, partial [Gemmataceae bacterium]|nr:hypothetical protein [Gemmataceae bacterium]